MNQHRNALIVIGFGVLTALGGFMGYKMAGSTPSLIGGFVAGILLLISGLSMMKRSVLGYFTACFVSALLLLFFGYRFANTGKVAPSGIMALASLGVFAILITKK